jgi:uncharacterized protein (DUF433 family)
MNREITLIDRGRGLQLSTSRVRVQDLVPYFQEGCSTEEILRWMPTLGKEEIAVVEHYYHAHREELDKEARLIQERNDLRTNPEWVEKVLTEARAQRGAIMERLREEKANGDAR